MTSVPIRLEQETRNRLKKLRITRHDTYDEIIIRLMNHYTTDISADNYEKGVNST